jgi:quercetin 2,3-dioxygenase
MQIWILPDRQGATPRYRDAHFPPASRTGRLCPIASPDGRDGSLPIHQDATVYASLLQDGTAVETTLAAGRSAYVQVVRGGLAVNGASLVAGDGAAIRGEPAIRLAASGEAEFLYFDLP